MDRASNVVDAICDAPDPGLDGLRARQDETQRICHEEPVSVSQQFAGNVLQDETQALPIDYAYPCGLGLATRWGVQQGDLYIHGGRWI